MIYDPIKNCYFIYKENYFIITNRNDFIIKYYTAELNIIFKPWFSIQWFNLQLQDNLVIFYKNRFIITTRDNFYIASEKIQGTNKYNSYLKIGESIYDMKLRCVTKIFANYGGFESLKYLPECGFCNIYHMFGMSKTTHDGGADINNMIVPINNAAEINPWHTTSRKIQIITDILSALPKIVIEKLLSEIFR